MSNSARLRGRVCPSLLPHRCQELKVEAAAWVQIYSGKCPAHKPCEGRLCECEQNPGSRGRQEGVHCKCQLPALLAERTCPRGPPGSHSTDCARGWWAGRMHLTDCPVRLHVKFLTKLLRNHRPCPDKQQLSQRLGEGGPCSRPRPIATSSLGLRPTSLSSRSQKPPAKTASLFPSPGASPAGSILGRWGPGARLALTEDIVKGAHCGKKPA